MLPAFAPVMLCGGVELAVVVAQYHAVFAAEVGVGLGRYQLVKWLIKQFDGNDELDASISPQPTQRGPQLIAGHLLDLVKRVHGFLLLVDRPTPLLVMMHGHS